MIAARTVRSELEKNIGVSNSKHFLCNLRYNRHRSISKSSRQDSAGEKTAVKVRNIHFILKWLNIFKKIIAFESYSIACILLGHHFLNQLVNIFCLSISLFVNLLCLRCLATKVEPRTIRLQQVYILNLFHYSRNIHVLCDMNKLYPLFCVCTFVGTSNWFQFQQKRLPNVLTLIAKLRLHSNSLPFH